MGNFIDISISFIMSPRTLNSVGNWCFYKISLVHLLFSTLFYIFDHISVGFGPINMFLGTFKRVFKGLQKASLHDWFTLTGLFLGSGAMSRTVTGFSFSFQKCASEK